MTRSFIPKDLRDVLVSLAEAVVPIEKWFTARELDYTPSEDDLPWRGKPKDRYKFNTKNLKVVEYLEAYWSDLASSEAALIAQLNDVQELPPVDLFSKSWRKKRKLDAESEFGAARSDNTPLVEVDGETNEHVVIGRAAFYRHSWEPLRDAIELFGNHHSSEGNAWTNFAKWMHRGEFGDRLSEFIRLFTIDVLRALMNQDNAELEYPWQAAFLIELGEGRRYGVEPNLISGPTSGKHTVQEVALSVVALDTKIK